MNHLQTNPAPIPTWRNWDRELEYGQLFFDRATGKLPEMQSSKAIAKVVKQLLPTGGKILDVGCGGGHYLRSLLGEIKEPFHYTGVDITASYIDLARKAWKDHPRARFEVADVFALPFKDGEFDVVMTCNVLQHLPSIQTPLRELVRVSNQHVIARIMVGDRSFRIQEVYSPETHSKAWPGPAVGEEFDERGEPRAFHYFNIYSRTWIEKVLGVVPEVASISFVPDVDFDPQAIMVDAEKPDAPPDATRMVGGWQVNGHILQPWHFVKVQKR